MKKILITAFEPFGARETNASAAVLEKLPDRILDYHAEKILLPVVYGKAAETALQHPADTVFLLGEAGGRNTVTPELQAVNIREAQIPDNEGNKPAAEKILPDGPDVYATPFPVSRIVLQMKEEKYRIEVSGDAGRYVCNDTFYLVGTGSRVPVVFIHCPAEPERAREFAGAVARFIGLALSVL